METMEEKTQVKVAYGTGEWAKSNVNIQSGCEHDCSYCYAKKNGVRFKRETPSSWRDITLNMKAINKGYGKRKGTVMCPSSHDITPSNLKDYKSVLRKILEPGNNVLVVSKPHHDCITEICREFSGYKEQILFRFTIGSADSAILKFWEPGAPSFQERLSCLKYAFDHGYKTSVSAEPMLDANVKRLIDAVRPYVSDSIWLGRVNQIKGALTVNAPGNDDLQRAAVRLEQELCDERILAIYEAYKNDPAIRWKDSIKKVVGLERPTEMGLDI